MAYGNYQFSPGGYQSNGRPYGNNSNGGNFNGGYNGYSRNYQQRGQQSQNGAPKKKYNACRMKTSYVSKKTGDVVNAPCVSGYIRKYGESISYVAVPAKKKIETKNPNIKRMVVQITPGSFGQPYLTNGFFNKAKQIMTIPDLNLLCNPGQNYTIKLTRRR